MDVQGKGEQKLTRRFLVRHLINEDRLDMLYRTVDGHMRRLFYEAQLNEELRQGEPLAGTGGRS